MASVEDHILILNAGSSSLKFCVFQRPYSGEWRQQARGQIEGIGAAPRLVVKNANGEAVTDESLPPTVADGRVALQVLIDHLRSTYPNARLAGVGHRIVHGGPKRVGPTRITKSILSELLDLVPLAPLHQRHNLLPVEVIFERLPDVPQVACFDTSFHRGHAKVVELVPLPREFRELGIARYGFHGISYEYIASVLPEVAAEIAGGKVIVAHLGSGASLCGMQSGKSVDTTMSFTALDGLCMSTRPGSLDPGVVLHLIQGLRIQPSQLEEILYRKSGLLGISGTTCDMRELLTQTDPDSRLAVDYFVYRVQKEIGALASVLGGVDGLVFTGGIGENSAILRKRIISASQWLGFELDEVANAGNCPLISTQRSKPSAWVIPTNEEHMIFNHTRSLLM